MTSSHDPSQLCRQLRREEVIADLSQHALRTDDLEELLKAAVDAVHGVLDAEYCGVFEHGPGDDSVRLRAGVDPDGSLLEAATVSIGQETGSGVRFPFDGSIAAHRDAESESTDADGADGAEIVSEISATGESWGVLGVRTTERSGFEAGATAFIERVADVLGTAIDACRERAGAVEHHRVSTEGFFSIDEQWRFVHVNDRATEFFDRNPETLRGEVVWDVVPEESALADRFREAMAAGETGTVEHSLDAIDRRGEFTVSPSETGVAVCVRDITERRDHERWLSTLIENVPGMVYRCRNERGWPMEFVSDAGADLTGYEPEAFVEGEVTYGFDVVAEGDRDELWESIQATVTDREPFSKTYRIETADGETRWVRDYGRGVFDENGTLVALEGIIADVTERKRLETELEEVLGRVTDAFYALDDRWRFTHVNERAEDLIDYTGSGLEGERIWDVFEWGADSRLREEYERAMESQEPRSFEFYYPEPLDAWFEVNAYPSETGLSVYFRDVSDRIERERALAESERRYRALVENFPNGAVALVDTDLRYQTVGGAPESTADTSADEAVGERVEAAVPDDLAAELVPRYEAAIEDGETDTFELERGDRIFQFRIVPVYDDGDVFAALGMSQDVTARRSSERRLEESEQRYRTLAEYFPNGLVTLFDHDLEYTLAAGQGFEKVSVDPETAEGEYFADVWGEGAAETLRPVFEAALEGEEETVELSYEGREWVLRGVPITDERGDVFAGMTMAQDITDRKTYERTLESLNESATALLSAETGGAVSETVVKTAVSVLDLPCVACYRYDDDRGVLVPDAHTTTPSFPVDDVPELPADGDSWTARAFRSGEARHFGEATEPDDVAVTAEDAEMRAGIAVPIGPHGVVVAGAGTPDAIDDRHRTQLGILATNARAAYDRVEREREFRETRDRLEAATEAGAVGTWDWDPQTDELVVGEAFAETFGVDPVAAREGVSLDQFTGSIHEADRERVEAEIEAALESGGQYEAEYRVHDTDGDLRWVVARGRVECDEHGEPASFPGALTDITERKRAELELERNKEQLETLFDVLPVGVLVAESDGELVQANDTAREIWGGMTLDAESIEEYDRYPIYDTETGERIEPDRVTLARVLRGEEVTEPDVYAIETADGERRIVESQGRPVRNEDGEITRGVMTFADVTEQHEYRRRLEESERRYRTLVEHFPDGAVGLFDEELEYITVGGELVEEGDRTAEELTGSSVYDLYPEEFLEEIEPHFRAAIRGEPATFEVEFQGRYLSAHTLPIHDADGTVFAGMLVVQDVTERREQERKLRERERRLERYREYTDDVLDAIDDVFYILDESGDLQRWNESLASVTGYDDEEIAAMNTIEFFDERHHDRIAEAIQTGFESGYTQVEASLLTTDGEEVPYEFIASPLDDPDGRTVLAGIGRDITERRERRRQLEESNERLEQFAYAASHDLQEPLRMVSSYLQLIERRYGDALDEDGEEFLEFAVDGAERMSDMIEGLLAYSRVETQGDPFEPVDLEDVLGEVCEDLMLSIRESGAEIEADPLPTVHGDRDQLRQVFQNLLGNAIEYSGDDPPRVEVSAERDGSEWIVSVRDNGIGIDPDDTERIFEVFQRLHGQTEHDGTGIGLALVERIVERHGGRIWVESEPGEGSTFSFTLAHNGETNE